MNNLCNLIKQYGPPLARILLAQLFIVSGFGKIKAFGGTAAYMASQGMPMAEVLLVLTIALELGGGILLVLGWQARWIAAAFFGFTLLSSVIFHAFWAADTANFTNQLNNFMKNLSIMGGMLYVMAYGAGPCSLGADGCATGAGSGEKGGK
jgi:putative oxidoreductase